MTSPCAWTVEHIDQIARVETDARAPRRRRRPRSPRSPRPDPGCSPTSRACPSRAELHARATARSRGATMRRSAASRSSRLARTCTRVLSRDHLPVVGELAVHQPHEERHVRHDDARRPWARRAASSRRRRASSRSLRASTSPFRGMMTQRSSFASGDLTLDHGEAVAVGGDHAKGTLSRPPTRYTPDRLKRVSSDETANSVLSIISRKRAGATRDSWRFRRRRLQRKLGKSFGSRLTILNFERPASTSTHPGLRGAEHDLVGCHLAHDLVELARVEVTLPFFFTCAGTVSRRPTSMSVAVSADPAARPAR